MAEFARNTHIEHNVQLFIYTQVMNIFYERSVEHNIQIKFHLAQDTRHAIMLLLHHNFLLKKMVCDYARDRNFSRTWLDLPTQPHHPPSWMRLLIIVPRTIYLLLSPNRSTHS